MQQQVESLQNILGSESLQVQAEATGFCVRSSKLTAAVFFDLLFYASSLSANSSLDYLVSYLENRYGIEMRKQSLDERFSEKTVDFVKSVLDRLIREQFSDMLYSEGFLSGFEHVRIKDSTKFNIPSHLASQFKGSGGSGSTSDAGISIQYEFDLKTGKFLDLHLSEAIRNDQRDANETAENFCKNDLVLRDMGYFSTSVLSKIIEKEAYFLSRLPTSVSVYEANGTEIDFKKLYGWMSKNGIEKCEKSILIGSKDKVPVRFAIGLVPPQVYQQRLRSKEKEAKKKGRQIKERTKYLLRFNLFVTNVEEEKLPIEKIMPLYRFRWQVELMFKNWKSVFSIHALQKMKAERYITMLYTRLILIVVNLQLINKMQSTLNKEELHDHILSYNKAVQTLKNRFREILHILRCRQEEAIKYLEDIYRLLSKKSLAGKTKKKRKFC